MAGKIGPQDVDVVIKFGAGLHTRPPEDEIADNEAADGYNFDLDVENSDLRPRAPFDLIGTLPNAGSVLGGGSFRLADGSVKAFFQGTTKVYQWDGTSFTSAAPLDTVDSTAQLRGHWRSHSWELDGLLLISDLNLKEPVKQWDGTTWADINFLSTPSTAFGSAFLCKYISVVDERAVYANCKEGSTLLPHVMVGSQRSEHAIISVSDRPASSLGESDPFFMLSPDLRGINGFTEAFGKAIISTQYGKLFQLDGASAKDFAFTEFFPGSFAAGHESLAYIGNNVIYGRQGRIESAVDTDRFGDSAADDLTKGIGDRVKTYTGWTAVYNSRLNRVYLFPDDEQEVWVFDNAIKEGKVSPWMRFTSAHALGFLPTFVMSMLDPSDGLEYIFMGDENGNVYRLEGTGTTGDGGAASAPIASSGGTAIGNMTSGGNLAAAFDVTVSQAAAACAERTSATSGYVGKTLATAARIVKARLRGSNDAGYVSGANPGIEARLYGKQGTAPANGTDGTLLGTISFTDTANESAAREITSTDTDTAWDHVWVNVLQDGAAATMAVAELELFARVDGEPVSTQWVSKLFSLPLNAIGNRIQGYVKYRKNDAVAVSIDLLYAGEAVYEDGVTVNLPAAQANGYYNSNYYYSNDVPYGAAGLDRLVRQRIEIPGGDTNEFQVRVSVESANDFDINEIGLRFSAKA
jgi:hypothetical protein